MKSLSVERHRTGLVVFRIRNRKDARRRTAQASSCFAVDLQAA